MESNVKTKFDSYPESVRPRLMALRRLILRTARECKVHDLTETLRWGEPSYVSKQGTTVRLDWKPKTPNQYAIYFNCNTMLVDTFQELYGDDFKYEGNRAIVFGIDEKVPAKKLKHCISLALRYKKMKHLPLLGA